MGIIWSKLAYAESIIDMRINFAAVKVRESASVERFEKESNTVFLIALSLKMLPYSMSSPSFLLKLHCSIAFLTLSLVNRLF